MSFYIEVASNVTVDRRNVVVKLGSQFRYYIGICRVTTYLNSNCAVGLCSPLMIHFHSASNVAFHMQGHGSRLIYLKVTVVASEKF